MDQVPDHTEWSNVDSYLHRKLRDLRDRVEKLELERRPRLLVNEGVECSELVHIFPVGGGSCLCGRSGGAV